MGTLVFLVLLGGCVSPTFKPILIDDPSSFNYLHGEDIKVRIAGDRSLLMPPEILNVEPVKWLDKTGISPLLRKQLEDFLREYFYQEMLYENYRGMILLKRDELGVYRDTDRRAASLKLGVTRVSEGNGFLRYLVGLGMGRTDLQVEGILVDESSGREIMAFVLRERHLGNSYNGMNPRCISARYCLRLSIEKAALTMGGIIRELWYNMEQAGTPHPLYAVTWER